MVALESQIDVFLLKPTPIKYLGIMETDVSYKSTLA